MQQNFVFRATRFEGQPWRAAAAAAREATAKHMEDMARGERVATLTHGESAAMRCDVVLETSTAVVETRRSRRTCVVAQRPRRLGATTVEVLRCG